MKVEVPTFRISDEVEKRLFFTPEDIGVLKESGFITTNQIIYRPMYYTGNNYGRLFPSVVAWKSTDLFPGKMIEKLFDRDMSGNIINDEPVFSVRHHLYRGNAIKHHYAYCSSADRQYYFHAAACTPTNKNLEQLIKNGYWAWPEMNKQ